VSTDHSFRRDNYTLGGYATPQQVNPRRVFLQATPEAIPYSDRKAMGDAVTAWPLRNVVYAQCRATGLSPYDSFLAAKFEPKQYADASREPGIASNDMIAREMGVPAHEVARILNPEPKAERQARAGTGRPGLKTRRPGGFF
jgi:hypothetical protein